jgi:hypothetical protein
MFDIKAERKERRRTANRPVREDGGYIHHHLLMTWVESLSYDWHQYYGRVWCRGPVDMSGTIDLFTSIDRDVTLIDTFLDGAPDTRYRKNGDEWEALFNNYRRYSVSNCHKCKFSCVRNAALECHVEAPHTAFGGGAFWPIVQPTDWCPKFKTREPF